MKSIHFLIVSSGRETLSELIESLIPQIETCDLITIVFDGVSATRVIDHPQIRVVEEKEKHGFWGHPLRTKYINCLSGDYIHNMDDDDVYLPNSIDLMRQELDGSEIVTFNYQIEKTGKTLKLYEDNYTPLIRTQQACIKNTRNIESVFTNTYTGDCSFFDQLRRNATIKYTDKIILLKR